MAPAATTFDDNGRRLLIAHYAFYHSLDTGSRKPATPAQEHFVSVCRGRASPETDHERAYSSFKGAITAAGLDEAAIVASGFVLLPELADDAAARAGTTVDIPVRRCAGCGNLIPPERLEAIPHATRCVACQEQTESPASDWHISEVECPRCASRGITSFLVWRTAHDPAIPGYFLGCSRFPDCPYVDRSNAR